MPHYHDMGLDGQFLQPLYLGCRYVFTSPITFIKRPVLWLELITRYRGTITVAPNFGYELALRRVTDKLVHQPTIRAKELGDRDAVSYATALAELFALDPEAVDAVTRPVEPIHPGEES